MTATPPPESARLLGPERLRAFDEGLSPLLRHACDGPVTMALTADRAPAYLTLLDALVLMRRDHEIEPLHDEVYRRVAHVLGRDDEPYLPEVFAHDIDQLRDWGCVERLAEVTKIRGYKDNRRERFRYRLTDDAVALVEWLEERLAEKLQGRAADGRDRLTDVVQYLREAVRCLDWKRASRTAGFRSRVARSNASGGGESVGRFAKGEGARPPALPDDRFQTERWRGRPRRFRTRCGGYAFEANATETSRVTGRLRGADRDPRGNGWRLTAPSSTFVG